MVLLKVFSNLIILILGLIFIVEAIKDKRLNIYPKSIWVLELILGIVISFCSFSFWLYTKSGEFVTIWQNFVKNVLEIKY